MATVKEEKKKIEKQQKEKKQTFFCFLIKNGGWEITVFYLKNLNEN